ncbi:hypothetical protein [Haladaptatus sp. DJG-WS-42]|uniref:DUF7311 family protein n=1 Tax=Haladaptatus sp. DJG-WS-42 TaxID=3120516 RepID=UPI0030CEA682
MILRVVLAALLATALVAVSLPAAERASIESTETQMRATMSHFQTAIEMLPAQTDPVSPEQSLTHHTITLRLPERTWTSARISHVIIEPTATGGVLRWQVSDGQPHALFIEGVCVETPGHPEGIEIVEPGTHRLGLTLETRTETTVVTVRRLP